MQVKERRNINWLIKRLFHCLSIGWSINDMDDKKYKRWTSSIET